MQTPHQVRLTLIRLSAAALLATTLSPAPRAQCDLAKLAADIPQAFTKFGSAVAIDGDRIVVGSPDAKPPGKTANGVAYVYRRGPAGWAFEQELSASDGAAFDSFGIAVAIDGNTILVGADGVDS